MSKVRAGQLIILGIAGIGLTNVFTGLSGAIWIALIFLFVQGIVNMLYYLPMIAITQREAPDYIRGRVMSTRFLLVQAGFLAGMASSGPLADRLGAPTVFVVSGILILAVGLVGALFPALRMATLDAPASAPPLLKAVS